MNVRSVCGRDDGGGEGAADASGGGGGRSWERLEALVVAHVANAEVVPRRQLDVARARSSSRACPFFPKVPRPALRDRACAFLAAREIPAACR